MCTYRSSRPASNTFQWSWRLAHGILVQAEHAFRTHRQHSGRARKRSQQHPSAALATNVVVQQLEGRTKLPDDAQCCKLSSGNTMRIHHIYLRLCTEMCSVSPPIFSRPMSRYGIQMICLIGCAGTLAIRAQNINRFVFVCKFIYLHHPCTEAKWNNLETKSRSLMFD